MNCLPLKHDFWKKLLQLDVSKNRGTPKWMVKMRENPIKMHDLEGTPIFGNTQLSTNWFSVTASLHASGAFCAEFSTSSKGLDI